MTSELKFKELITKRSSIKGRVTKFKIYLESLVALESISAVEVNKLAMKLSRMEALFIEFDGLQSQIEVHSEANQSAELSTRDFIEQEFDNCIAIAQDLIQSNSSAPKRVEERCSLKLQSNTSSFEVSMFCLVLKTISDDLPKHHFNISSLKLNNLELADPSFNEPSPIDMLIGSDLFWDLIGSEQRSLGLNNPNLHSSKLGWLIAGPAPIQMQPPPKRFLTCNFLQRKDKLEDIQEDLSQFWELENVPKSQPLSEEKRLCEKLFISDTRRESDGRFCVGIPLRDEPDCLGESYFIAKKRFYNLEARFRKNPELKNMYCDFIHEYADLGHLSESTETKPPNSYFLPHRPVIRDKSETTKLRVVFNASEPTTSSLSVNDLQMVGPTVQDSLFNILVRFRQHRYVISGDVEKMYRQSRVRESDRNLQLILWRDNEDEKLRTLRLNTITYGFASSSFLSTRCIWQIGDECDDSTIKTIIQNDIYCDDLLTGASTAEELRSIQRAVSSELAKGCFPLRKYRSNLLNVLEADPNNNKNLIISNAASTLELCGAFLGAELSSAVIKALRVELKRCVFWTDSCVVLGWLRSPDKTKTFVANRVAAIGELTDPKAWRYVPTAENPADLASRGVDPQEVNDSTIWWHGPMFLMQPESSWPILSAGNEVNLPELKAMHALVAEDVPAQRTKWRVKSRDLKQDDLVLIKEANTPPLCRRLGRVSRLYVGSDQTPRVADIATANGTIRRALNRLVLLSPDESHDA
ncbi:unnamed protein product, partial [Brenthis ino]